MPFVFEMNAAAIHAYRCPQCDAVTAADAAVVYACSSCQAEALDVELGACTVAASTMTERADRSMWRYQELLPVAAPAADDGPLRGCGGTPMYRATRAAKRLGLAEVWIKDDGRLPSGSLKDRASAVVVQRARAIGVDTVVAASTGNAGVAMAAMANAAAMRAIVLVPKSAPPAKIAQLMVFGAELYLVDGNYDDAFALSRQASLELGWYCRNTAYNPFTVEGKKTVSFEICDQLAANNQAFDAPDRIYVSVGDGNIIAGVHKGLCDLKRAGFIENMPKIVGIQAAGSAAIANAYAANSDRIDAVQANTVADSIAADQPADGLRALRAMRMTAGHCLVVSDEEILSAIVSLARDTTVFAEPAASAAYAGLLKDVARGELGAHERVVVLVTGNGLKDVAAAERATSAPPLIQPTLHSLVASIAKEKR